MYIYICIYKYTYTCKSPISLNIIMIYTTKSGLLNMTIVLHRGRSIIPATLLASRSGRETACPQEYSL